ncbi:dual specificity protein phosphatase 1B isoform X2 [Plutella xylostella]|uniref:dual specificity protein phosphatase 1B isoform X2 n=1 Tax=Plutella xylostella TaxID=51655 RepID=UPI002032F6E0|nr:dual specificity protein phosphatase 1B isoform X2 [Plutella xylostella]
MVNARRLLVLMLSVSIIAFLSWSHPVSAFKSWSRRLQAYATVDLCTEPCYSEIIPGLYLSNARAAADQDVLRNLNITHVLTIEIRRLPKSTFQGTNISTLYIRANDLPSTNLLPYFPMAHHFIEEGLRVGNVIVHCHFGVSRSATLVIAYLMKKYDMTFEQAFGYVKYRRNFVNPNSGFREQLREYREMNFDVNSFQRFEAYMSVAARRHRYKIASAAAVLASIVIPIAVLVKYYNVSWRDVVCSARSTLCIIVNYMMPQAQPSQN